MYSTQLTPVLDNLVFLISKRHKLNNFCLWFRVLFFCCGTMLWTISSLFCDCVQKLILTLILQKEKFSVKTTKHDWIYGIIYNQAHISLGVDHIFDDLIFIFTRRKEEENSMGSWSWLNSSQCPTQGYSCESTAGMNRSTLKPLFIGNTNIPAGWGSNH